MAEPEPAPATAPDHTLTRRQRSQQIYEWLRAANPHLPPADKVLAEDLTFAWGPEQEATLTLTVVVDVPVAPLPNVPVPPG